MRMITAILAATVCSAAYAQGPQTSPWDYEDARAEPFGNGTTVAWDILVASNEGAANLNRVHAELGPDWVAWRESTGPVQWVDLAEGRLLRLDAGTLTNIALVAEARRRLDIYAGLSRAGSLDEIQFGPAGRFHRIWLEAAMGVAARSGEIEIDQTGFGFEARFGGETVFSADYGDGEGSLCRQTRIDPDRRAATLALIRHAVPVHPDAFDALQARDTLPCAFSYTVYSPDSPQGRFESWVLREGNGQPLPRPDSATAEALPRETLIGPVGETAVSAVRVSTNEAPVPMEFFSDIQTLRATGDYAGALLVSIQETHHFGPCPEQSVGSARLSCAEATSLTREGASNESLQQVMQGMAALSQGEYPRAVERLAPFRMRNDRAGVAARILVANALVAWGREGLEARPDLDPAAMLAEALQLDPYAPDAYWHLGRRYLEAGAPHAAWTLFDLGRSLPGRDPTPLLAQADTLEARIAELAPDWLDPAGGGRESAQ
jgi:hypothetical protein